MRQHFFLTQQLLSAWPHLPHQWQELTGLLSLLQYFPRCLPLHTEHVGVKELPIGATYLGHKVIFYLPLHNCRWRQQFTWVWVCPRLWHQSHVTKSLIWYVFLESSRVEGSSGGIQLLDIQQPGLVTLWCATETKTYLTSLQFFFSFG
jgi:hypothetical protein